MNDGRLIVAVLALAFLAGCSEPETQSASLEAPKALKVDHVRVEFTPNFAPGSADLSAAERARFEAFLGEAGLRPDDRVYIVPGRGDGLTARRIGSLVRVLNPRSIGAQTVEVSPTGTSSDRLRVVADRYVVTPPSCPDWSRAPSGDHANFPASNFGCASLVDLGLMVDNPRDLELGRALAPADAEPTIGAVQRYRTGTVKAIVSASGDQAAAAPPAAAAAPPAGGPPPSGQ